ncbi:3-isopropylmalate dehydrogenase [bacterium HR24]|jgi:3-isopropylmalate dehydrogenase|nr:3-isopropylmalate dehydrogenase [bacterium HR24]
MGTYRIIALPGDGVGPEVMAEGLRVLQAVERRFGHRFQVEEDLVGGACIDRYGLAIRPETLERCRRAHAVLLAAVGGPKWDDPTAPVRPEQGLLALRKGLGLFANLRPVKVYPFLTGASTLRPEVLEGVDLVVVRELTGGIYFGRPQRRWRNARGWQAVDTLRYSEDEVRRILRVGFELARARRKRLTSVDKANILESSRLWRALAMEVAEEYPDVELRHMLVDACAMHLIRRPADFDVIVTENMFGDILTDEAAMLAGSMGMLPSASLGRRRRDGTGLGLYEPVHGSAPDIAGQGVANPLAMILSVAMMLRHSLGLPAEAQAVEEAVERVLAAGYRTLDIAQEGTRLVGTREMGEKVAEAVEG